MNEIVILTYSDLFGNIVSKDKIIERIRKLKPLIGLATISYLITNRKSERFLRNISQVYIAQKSEIISLEAINKILSRNSVLYSLQGLLFLSKYIYAYNEAFDSDLNQEHDITYDKTDIRRILDLQLMLSDYIQTEITDKAFRYYCMKKFSLSYNLKSLISRTWYIFTTLSVSKEIEEKHEQIYTDFNKKFFEKNKYSISDFLCTYFYLFSPFVSDGKESKGILIDAKHHFDESRNPKMCNTILNELICPIDNYNEFSKKTIQNSWDYEILTEFPVLQISPKLYTVISDQHLQENIIENLISKIGKMYDDENVFKQFLGYPFERYVQLLSLSSTTISKNYKFKNEFEIRKNLKSSDGYIFNNNSMLIIEVKSKTLSRIKLFEECSSENIKCKINDQFVKPTQQIDNRCQDILGSQKYSYLFDNITEIFSVIVNFENCYLSVPEYHKYAIDNIYSDDTNGERHIRTKGLKYFFSFGIEEFECLCWLIENNYDISRILREYYPYSNEYFLYNYLEMEGIHFEIVPKMVNNNWTKAISVFQKFMIK